MPENDGHVVIAGFGRVGQIVARILTRQAHPLHRARLRPRAGRFRAQVRRPDLLRRRQPARDPGSGADRQGARLRARHRRRRGLAPHRAAGAAALPARADLRPLAPPPAHAPADGRRHQDHSPRDVPVLARPDARGAARAWACPSATCALRSTPSRRTDRRRLYEDYKHYTDLEKLQERAKSHAQELEGMFAQDAAEQAKAAKEPATSPLPALRGEG